MTSKRQMHFGVSLGDSGVHPRAWRLPSSRSSQTPSIAHFIDLAKTAERGLFDMVFTADGLELNRDRIATEQPWREFEPLLLMSALAVSTERVGLVSTASTTFSEPYNIARMFATLDHISGGRAAWNAVTSHRGAENFGMAEVPVHEVRYARATEFIEVVIALWDSWEPDAKVHDVENGVYADPSKIHEIDYVGDVFSVKGPLNISRTPQGRPVIVQAGSSSYGMELGAKYGEVIFTAQSDMAESVRFYRQMHELAATFGRGENEPLILPGISPIVAPTEAEAKELFETLTDTMPREFMIQMASDALHVDLGGYDVGDTVPESILPDPKEVEGHQSRYTIFRAWAVEDGLTIRQLAQRSAAHGHWLMVGSGEQIADILQERFEAYGADGFNIVPQALPLVLENFVDHVVPILQERGLYRTEYEGSTLREHLGLPVPENAWTMQHA